MSELLLELLSEEIPARMQAKASHDLKNLLCQELKTVGLLFDTARCYYTARRLTVHITGLPLTSKASITERRGPKENAPEKAITGFLRSAGLERLEQAEVRETPKGRFYFAVQKIEGKPSSVLLPSLILTVLQGLSWPKSMRFGYASFRWVRPLKNILALFDGKALEGYLELGEDKELSFNNLTYGHRFMAPEAIKISSFAQYQQALRAAKVIVDPAERETVIKSGLNALAQKAGLKLIVDEKLLAEVNGLVEWPVPLLGQFDPAFLHVPRECLILSMKEHQKYFALNDTKGQLSSHFIVVSNIATLDKGAAIISGNERVLQARLSDARFFWEQDQKISLEARLPKLKTVVFHAKIGSMAQKVEHIKTMIEEISGYIPGLDKSLALRAAELSKADLVSQMVYEFPELQGTMGQYYAKLDGESSEVALAIREHYAPLGPRDTCPKSPVSVALGIAEKLATLCAFWKIDEKPTGSKDPFALRRAALGLLRLILENELPVPLESILSKTLGLKAADLIGFIVERFKGLLYERFANHGIIEAVFAQSTFDDFCAILARVEALMRFHDTKEGSNLLIAYKRAANILRSYKEEQDFVGRTVDEKLLYEVEEKELFRVLKSSSVIIGKAIKAQNYPKAMFEMASLREPLDCFFENVIVNAEDKTLRLNRLTLLAKLVALMNQVADFSKIES